MRGVMFLVALLVATSLSAQDTDGLVPTGACPPNADYAALGYRIRQAKVREPFAFVRRVGLVTAQADKIVTQLTGTAFDYAAIHAVGDKLADLQWLPGASEQRVQIDALIASVEDCLADELDVVYSVYSSQILALPGLTWERQQQERTSPQSVAGVDQERGIPSLRPVLTYNATEQLGGGISGVYRPRAASSLLDAVTISAVKARNARQLDAALSGKQVYEHRWFSGSTWAAAYTTSATPAFATTLRRTQATAQYAVVTQPLRGIVPLRFGLQTGGGKKDVTTTLVRGTETPGKYLSTTLLAGAAGTIKNNTFSASYALELGSVRDHPDSWHKQLFDFADDVALPLRRHQLLEAESRVTLGRLHASGPVPIGMRFFGGNKEELLTPDPQWQIRAYPVIRSIPANRFVLPRGADAFLSYNLTVSYPLWSVPVVPSALTNDPTFSQILEKQLVSAQNALAVDYYAKDAHVRAAAALLPDVTTALAALKQAVAPHQQSLDSTTRPLWTACANAINIAQRRTTAAQKAKGAAQYGDFGPLVPMSEHENGEDRLQTTVVACRTLNQQLHDSVVEAALNRLATTTSSLVSAFHQLDRTKADAAAGQELAPAKQILHRLLYQLNLFSVGPVFLFDAARLSDGPSVLNRYGTGGGLRFTLASSVNMTIGYLTNHNRLPGESPGAFTASLQFRDFLQ